MSVVVELNCADLYISLQQHTLSLLDTVQETDSQKILG